MSKAAKMAKAATVSDTRMRAFAHIGNRPQGSRDFHSDNKKTPGFSPGAKAF
jgi:hypothetical protein